MICWGNLSLSKIIGGGGHPAPPHPFILQNCVYKAISNYWLFLKASYLSVNSKPDHPPRATPGNSHILVAPGVGFSLLCLARDLSRGSARGLAPGGLKSK